MPENETTLGPTDAAHREAWFLARLDEDPLPTDELVRFLDGLRTAGDHDRAQSWAELLEDTLVERGRLAEAVGVLHARAAWPEIGRDLEPWKARALALLDSNADQRSLVAHAGWENVPTPAEALRRLCLLLALRPGTLCLDRTWGFGVVRRVDHFYGRVEIDFERRQDHFLSLAYAAEAIELLSEDHLLVRQHRDPEGMARLVREQPAEVVRLGLRSYGPLTAAQLQEKLTPGLVAEGDWKRFWDAARAVLKKDPLVAIPAKRAEPIRLLEKPEAFDQGWLERLADERDLDRLADEIERYLREREAAETPAFQAAAREALGERLAFLLKGAGRSRPDLEVRAVLAGERLGCPVAADGEPTRIRQWLEPSRFLEILGALPARTIPLFLDALEREDAAAARGLWLEHLNRMSLPALAEVMDRLVAAGEEPRCAETLRTLLAGRKAEVEVLCWLTKHRERVNAWALATPAELVTQVLDELARDYSGERLKAKNQLRARFEQKEWLEPMLAALDDRTRRQIFQRVRESPAWSALDRQSLLGRIVKQYPEMEQILAEAAAGRPAETAALTSWRSYRERQAQLEKLVREDLPRNSREIAHARSLGDLRENFEFKAAKEMQGILLRRRAEWETMLRRVHPTDFRDLPKDRAGMGTSVLLRHADGREERIHILGEWDQDDALRIISAQTRLAQALAGRRAGETVRIPSEAGEVECVLAEVGDLPPEIRAWVGGP